MTGVKQFDPEEALDLATDLFQRKGFGATSMQDIVDTLGIGRGSLYQTFGNKQQLYLASLENYHTKQRRWMKKLFDGVATAKEGARALLDAVVGRCLGERQGCLVGNTVLERAIHDPESEEAVDRAITANIEFLTEVFVRAQQEGSLSPDREPSRVARLFQTGLQGLFLMGVARPNRRTLNEIADDLFDSIFQQAV